MGRRTLDLAGQYLGRAGNPTQMGSRTQLGGTSFQQQGGSGMELVQTPPKNLRCFLLPLPEVELGPGIEAVSSVKPQKDWQVVWMFIQPVKLYVAGAAATVDLPLVQPVILDFTWEITVENILVGTDSQLLQVAGLPALAFAADGQMPDFIFDGGQPTLDFNVRLKNNSATRTHKVRPMAVALSAK